MPLRRLGNFVRLRILRRRARNFAPFSTLGVEPAQGDAWRSVSSDPQFVFAVPRQGGGALVVDLRALEGPLAPRLYFDWGQGFSQSESLDLDGADGLRLVVDVADCPDLVRLRLDPSETPGRFELRWRFDAPSDDEDRRTVVAARDFAPALGARPLGARKRPASVHEIFLRGLALAERELGGRYADPPPEPVISFVTPVFNTNPAYLDDLIASFRSQPAGYAELVLSDDGSQSPQTRAWLDAHAGEPDLIVLRGAANRGIAAASNAGLGAARGRWIGFVDHDDALAPHAVSVLLRAIEQNPDARFFYTDELIADAELKGVEAFDKPAFDDVLLSGCNYINHISLYRRDLIEAVGGFREGFEGSQDYDLVLRATARLRRDEIRHVPYPAYVWRHHGGNFSVKFLERATANARRALAEAYARDGRAPEVSPSILPHRHRVRVDLVARAPKISVVVPNLDAPKLMAEVADGLFKRTDYPDFELIVVDNGSTDRATLALYERLRRAHDNFRLDIRPAPFNFSAQVNRGAALARGEAILLLNNDIEVLTRDWLREMAGCLAFPDVGVVGARLLYPNRKLQHAGVVMGVNGGACHWYIGRPADHPGPIGRLAMRSTMSAVTGACMLITRACWEATGPFDETGFAVAFNDVDFCLRAGKAGFRTLYTPFATLIHRESASRGLDTAGPKRERFLREVALLLERHQADKYNDPVTSPWRGRDGTEPEFIAPDRLPAAR